MSKTHLTLSDRVRIQSGLDKSESFKKIAQDIGKNCTTVSREVRNHSYDVTSVKYQFLFCCSLYVKQLCASRLSRQTESVFQHLTTFIFMDWLP